MASASVMTRSILLSASALCLLLPCQADAQDMIVMRRQIAPPRTRHVPTPAPTPTPTPSKVTCGAYSTFTWDGSSYPPAVVYNLGPIPDVASAHAQCAAKAASIGKPGVCLHYDGPTGETYYISDGKLGRADRVQHTGSTCTSG